MIIKRIQSKNLRILNSASTLVKLLVDQKRDQQLAGTPVCLTTKAGAASTSQVLGSGGQITNRHRVLRDARTGTARRNDLHIRVVTANILAVREIQRIAVEVAVGMVRVAVADVKVQHLVLVTLLHIVRRLALDQLTRKPEPETILTLHPAQVATAAGMSSLVRVADDEHANSQVGILELVIYRGRTNVTVLRNCHRQGLNLLFLSHSGPGGFLLLDFLGVQRLQGVTLGLNDLTSQQSHALLHLALFALIVAHHASFFLFQFLFHDAEVA